MVLTAGRTLWRVNASGEAGPEVGVDAGQEPEDGGSPNPGQGRDDDTVQPGSDCETDADCSYNGVCEGDACNPIERWCERKCGWSVGNLRFRPISTTPPLCAWGNTPEAKSWKAKELESQGAGKQSFAARKARPGGTRFTFAFWPFFFASFLSNSAAIFAAKIHFSLVFCFLVEFPTSVVWD